MGRRVQEAGVGIGAKRGCEVGVGGTGGVGGEERRETKGCGEEGGWWEARGEMDQRGWRAPKVAGMVGERGAKAVGIAQGTDQGQEGRRKGRRRGQLTLGKCGRRWDA